MLADVVPPTFVLDDERSGPIAAPFEVPFADAVARDWGLPVEAQRTRYEALGLTGGVQRVWTRSTDEILLRILEFRDESGAARALAGTSGYTTTVDGIPGSRAWRGPRPGLQRGSLVWFRRGARVAAVQVRAPKDEAEAIARELALEQYARLPDFDVAESEWHRSLDLLPHTVVGDAARWVLGVVASAGANHSVEEVAARFASRLQQLVAPATFWAQLAAVATKITDPVVREVISVSEHAIVIAVRSPGGVVYDLSCEVEPEERHGITRVRIDARRDGSHRLASTSPRAVQDVLDELARVHGVPGASLAVLQAGVIRSFVTGCASRRTGVDVTPDTLFQIGSITKLYTATLVMQLVDEGLASLDVRVRSYLPELELTDEHAAETITLRHLLTHTCGIEGDHFPDTGTGDDAIERCIATYRQLEQVHAPGAMYSYSNSGYTLAGRVAEKVTGLPFAKAMKQRVLDPLDLRSTVLSPDEAVLHRVAVGHVNGTDGQPYAVGTWSLPRSGLPAGACTAATARDVLRFAAFHLGDGAPVLRRESVAAMQAPHADVPDQPGVGAHIGLGWRITDHAGARAIGHNGGAGSQTSFLLLVPSEGFGICLLTNMNAAARLWRDVLSEILRAATGLMVPDAPEQLPPAPEFDAARYIGTYSTTRLSYDVSARDGRLFLAMSLRRRSATPDDTTPAAPARVTLEPLGEHRFLVGEGGVAHFLGIGDRADYLHYAGRAAPRRDS